MDVLSWKVGDVRITRVQEFQAPGMRFLLPDATPENLTAVGWLGPFLDASGEAVGSVHSLVVDAADRRIVVDTCIGNDKQRGVPLWNERQGPFLEDLRRAGFPPDSIDTVICTHLHVDHVGWNTRLVDGRWVPTFERARYLLARPEWEHWSSATEAEAPQIMADSVRPVFEAGLVDLVETDHEVAPGVTLEPTPGHTPGHVAVHISSEGEEAVITGDLVHHPVQFHHPAWRNTVDTDPDQAERTRLDFMATYADTPVLVIGTHFAGPTAGHLVRDGDVYRLDN